MKERLDDVSNVEMSPGWGFRYERRITPDLLDQDNEHMAYLGFVRIFEEAQRQFQERRGLDHENLLSRFDIRLFVKSLKVDFEGEVKEGETVSVYTKSLLPRRSSFSYDQAMLNSSNELVATSSFVIVGVGEDKKPKELPVELRRALTTLDDESYSKQ